MGLDMYLSVKKYESRFDNNKPIEKDFYPKEFEELQEMIFNHNFCSKYTTCQIGYWRKANAIHKWFVENCFTGDYEDYHGEAIDVSYDKLIELRDLCKQVLEDHDKAYELLPTQDGFFFGSTEYSEWYFGDLEYTIDLIDAIERMYTNVSPNYNYSFEYDASW